MSSPRSSKVRRMKREVFEKIFDPPLHAHLSYFGSELACQYCNPYFYKNHGMGKPFDCGDPDCPGNPENYKTKRIKIDTVNNDVGYSEKGK